jgi:hypothetical protein
MPPTGGPATITLPQDLNSCRHGKELRQLTTKPSLGRWFVWGHYACSECQILILDHFEAMPGEAQVGARRMIVQPLSDASPLHNAGGSDAETRQ